MLISIERKKETEVRTNGGGGEIGGRSNTERRKRNTESEREKGNAL